MPYMPPGIGAGISGDSSQYPSIGISPQTTLASTSQENSIQTIEITSFQDVESPAIAITPMAQNTTSIAHFDNTFDIKEFLRRPVKLWHSQLVAGAEYKLNEFTENDPQKPVKSWNLPGEILVRGGKLEKVTNHQYFKADIRIKVVLNTSPFVAGRYYLTYSPYESTISEPRQQKWASMAGLTAYPGVEIDAQLDNSVEIVLPFASFKESYVLTEKEEDFITLSLYAITELAGKEGATLDLAVYAWFDNIELNIPTLKEPIQAPDKVQTIEKPLSYDQNYKMSLGRSIMRLQKTDKSAYDYIMSYINPSRIRGSMQIQAEAKDKGPIESISSTVKDVAGVVKNVPIPIVNEIATGVGWVADIIGGIASIFGWSKPNSYKQICPVQNAPGKFYTHCDSEDQSVSLSLTAKNELDKLENIFPSAVDEMALGYVCANPAIKYIYRWVSSNKAGEAFTTIPLGLIPVGIGSFNAKKLASSEGFTSESILTCGAVDPCPGDGYAGGFLPLQCFNKVEGNETFMWSSNVRVRGSVNRFLISTAPCEYVSQMFKYWRATMCFKISIVKTAFHTGRLEIFFDPGMYVPKQRVPPGPDPHEYETFLPPDLSWYSDKDTTNNYKYILDLTNDTEITIKIPFVSEKLFLSTRGLNSGNKMPTFEQIADSIIGSLVVRPVSNLMCPDTVKNSVDVIVWKWAEDVVLSCPINAGGSDLTIYDRNTAPSFPDVHVTDIKDIVKTLPAIINGETINKPCDKRVTGSMQINIGNKAEGNVVVFFQTTNVEEENMKACKNATGERCVNLRPLLRVFRDYVKIPIVGGQINHTINAQAEDNKNNPDYLSYLSYMYRFFRGGFRYKIISDGTKVRSKLLENVGDSGKLTPSHITFPALNPMHEVSIPYYSQYRKLPISSTEAGIMQVNITGSGMTDVSTLRAGNDDLTFGWLMGTPQLVPGNTDIEWKSIDVIGNEVPAEDPTFFAGANIPKEVATKILSHLKAGKLGKPT